MDSELYDALNDLAGRASWSDQLIRWAAADLPIVMGILIVAAWFWPGIANARAHRECLALYAIAAALIGLGIAQVIGHLWFRDRPYIDHAHVLLLSPSPDPSFPSDHAVGAFGLAMPFVFARHPLRWPLLVCAFGLVIARVAAGTHYPSDVIGGALLGSAAALLVWHVRGVVKRPINWALSLAGRLHLA